jgi:NRPS condensation-like uncharacterized protein
MTSLQEVLRVAIKQSCNWFTRTRRPHPRELEASLEEQKQILASLLADEARKPVEFAASFTQEGLWYLNQLQPASAAYNLPVGLRLLGPLDRNALERSLQEIVNRHGALRTRFELGETQLLQVVIPQFLASLPIVDLSHLPEPQRSQETWQLALSETQLAFDLSQVPLFRVKLFRLQPDDHVLICVMHHIISDGWSLRLFVSELCDLYGAYSTGQESPLEPLPIQYGDYTSWQRQAMAGEAVLNQTLYWKCKLQGVPPLTQLPLDPNFRARENTETAVQAAPLSKELVDGLKQLSVGQDATLFMIALAAFTVLLWWRTRQEDIPIGVPHAGRDRVETEPLIGNFVNVLVF